jgi:hypothetical protein
MMAKYCSLNITYMRSKYFQVYRPRIDGSIPPTCPLCHKTSIKTPNISIVPDPLIMFALLIILPNSYSYNNVIILGVIPVSLSIL